MTVVNQCETVLGTSFFLAVRLQTRVNITCALVCPCNIIVIIEDEQNYKL